MKPFWLLVPAFVPFNSVSSQKVKHAPSIEQCRADQMLWLSKLEQVNDMHVSYKELQNWGIEMTDCEAVDPERRSHYDNTVGEIIGAKAIRLADFLDRHNLWAQFYAEDAQGKR